MKTTGLGGSGACITSSNVSASLVEDEGEGLPGQFFSFLKQLPIEGVISTVRARPQLSVSLSGQHNNLGGDP